MQSGAMACRFRAVSSSVSPFETLEVETLMLTASAESRLAAISNEVRVRVEASKKRLITVRPRSAGTFLISRFEISRKVSAVSSRWTIWPAESSRMPSKCLRFRLASMRFFLTGAQASRLLERVARIEGEQPRRFAPVKGSIKKAAAGAASRCSFGCRSLDDYNSFVFIEIIEHHLYDLTFFRRHKLTDIVRLNRQFPMLVSAINQHRQLDPPGSAKIDELVHRRAHRASGIEHVVNQHDRPRFDVARQFRPADNRFRADG